MSQITNQFTPQQATMALVERVSPVPSEQVPWSHAAGRVLAQAVHCDRPSPACDISAMDGYALRLADLSKSSIEVTGEALPGLSPLDLPPGKALRIVTGAPLPPQAELVVRREDVAAERPESIVLRAGLIIRAGENIRRRGENAPQGSIVLEAGDRITPAAMSALAAMGVARPIVHRRVRLAILTTGSEVLPVESAPPPWQLRDSNGPQLAALAATCPWLELISLGHVIDEAPALRQQLGKVLQECDAIILSGGVSMGSHDFVPAAVRSHGAEVLLHRLPIKPGKPILGAISPQGQPILALPGNPVSVLVTACRFAGPALRRVAGMNPLGFHAPHVHLDEPLKPFELWRYLPVRQTAAGMAHAVPNRGSGDLVAVAGSDGFVEVPPDSSSPGPLAFYRWEWR